MILHATYMDDAALEAVIATESADCADARFPGSFGRSWAEDRGQRLSAGPVRERNRRKSAGELRIAYDAGVPPARGTESGFSITPYGEWHWRESQILVDNLGLTPLQALRCATFEGARALGLAERVGTLELGEDADTHSW